MQPSKRNSRLLATNPQALDLLTHQPISALLHHSALLLVVSIALLFLIKLWVLEKHVLPRVYGTTYTEQLRGDERKRRNFVNHHIAALTKILCVVLGAYPFFLLYVGGGGDGTVATTTMQTPVVAAARVTVGDWLVVLAQLFVAMYVCELFTRMDVSIVSSVHHVAAITITEAVLGSGRSVLGEGIALEFALCLLWGAFDVLAELWPHIAMILYRVYPNRHRYLARWFLTICVVEVVSTVVETALIMWQLAELWKHLPLSFRISAIILHVVFSGAQLWCVKNFWDLYRVQIARGARRESNSTLEAGSGELIQPKGTVSSVVVEDI